LNAFKTRVNPTASVTGASTTVGANTTAAAFAQNLPGQFYPGSESGFIMGNASGGTAGLADFGTRLKATFFNVPAGVNLFVSTTNINPLGNTSVNPSVGTNLGAPAIAVAAGNFAAVPGSINFLAGLMASDTATAAPGAFLPLAAATNNSGGVNLYGPLPVDANGTATAVWEILLADPTVLKTADFAVFYTVSGAPPLTPVSTVALSLGPTFADATASSLIPRFAPASTATTIVSIAACQVAPSVTLSASPSPSTVRQAVTLRATVAAVGTGTPTGTVTFLDGAANLGAVALAGGQATLTTSALAPGTHPIVAQYGGDGVFPAMSSAVVSQVVNKAVTATALNVGSGAVNAGDTATFTATVTSSSGTPGGTVTFRDGGALLAIAPLDAAGVARASAGSLRIGAHSIAANYDGDANYLPSSAAAQNFSINAIVTAVSTPVLRSGTPAPGQPVTFAATVTVGGAPVSNGSLSFRDANLPLGSAPLDPAGTGVLTIARLAAGPHVITALYDGQARYAGANSDPLFLTVRYPSTVTLVSSLNPSPASSSITFTATVAGGPAGSPVPTGAIVFTEGAASLGTAPLNAAGQATITAPSGFAPGDHRILATYNGDPNFMLSSATLVQSVNRTATGTTLAEGAGANGFYLTASVGAASGGAPAGSAQFRDLTTAATIGSAPLSNGRATFGLTGPPPVGHRLQALYSGDASFAESASDPRIFIAAANGFSFADNFAPDSMNSIFGAGLSDSTEAAPGMPLPAILGGVTVDIVDASAGHHAAPLYYVSPAQINLVIPADVPLGPALLTITKPGGAFTIEIVITRAGPGLATADGSGSGPAAAQLIRVHRDGAQEPPVAISSAPIPFPAGDRLFLVLYGTGLRHAAQMGCSVNGQSIPILYSGPHGVYPGLDQVNLELPAGTSGPISIACSGDGQITNAVTVNLQ
jgi:uncharacterized protein (TIGR03437 family)